jgi:hypothetical protein
MRFVSKHRRFSIVAAAPIAIFLVLVAAGCGGIDKGKLESAIKSQTNKQLAAHGSSITVSSVHCSKAQDSRHFNCAVKNSDATSFNVFATCTKSGSYCTWKRA